MEFKWWPVTLEGKKPEDLKPELLRAIEVWGRAADEAIENRQLKAKEGA
jgi:hypothetical protein